MLLESFSTLATAEYKVIDIHDSTREIEETPSLQLPGRSILGGDTGHIYINCVDDVVRVLVSMRVWDTAPSEETAQGWSEPEEAELTCRSGSVYVNQWASGPAAVWNIPILGEFNVSMRHKGRDTVREKAREVRRQNSGTGQPVRERVSSLHELDGTEKYLVDIWPLSQ
jgi:hypothetical protein